MNHKPTNDISESPVTKGLQKVMKKPSVQLALSEHAISAEDVAEIYYAGAKAAGYEG